MCFILRVDVGADVMGRMTCRHMATYAHIMWLTWVHVCALVCVCACVSVRLVG